MYGPVYVFDMGRNPFLLKRSLLVVGEEWEMYWLKLVMWRIRAVKCHSETEMHILCACGTVTVHCCVHAMLPSSGPLPFSSRGKKWLLLWGGGRWDRENGQEILRGGLPQPQTAYKWLHMCMWIVIHVIYMFVLLYSVHVHVTLCSGVVQCSIVIICTS